MVLQSQWSMRGQTVIPHDHGIHEIVISHGDLGVRLGESGLPMGEITCRPLVVFS
jgi:hypothetical protein